LTIVAAEKVIEKSLDKEAHRQIMTKFWMKGPPETKIVRIIRGPVMNTPALFSVNFRMALEQKDLNRWQSDLRKVAALMKDMPCSL